MKWKEEDLQAFEARTKAWKEKGKVTTHRMEPESHQAKYRNRKTMVDGIEFDSQKEAHRWGVLKLRAYAGEITELERQVRFPLRVNGQEICCYIADFTYREAQKPGLVVEDSKGIKTRDYLLKKKLMSAIHGIEILET